VVRRQPGQIVYQTQSQKKNPSQNNRAGRVAQGIGPGFKPQYHQKREREREKSKLINSIKNNPG
jgi:hypothetical protein